MTKKHLLLVFSISLALRVVLFALSDRTTEESYNFGDGRGYLQYGRNLAEHGVLSEVKSPPYHRSAFRTPVYPLLIAAALKICPTENAAIVAVLVVQLILGALTACVGALAAFLLLKNATWATIAGVAIGLEPQSYYYSMLLFSESLFTFLLLSSVYFLFKHLETYPRQMRYMVFSAVLMGLASLCRPVGHYVALFGIPLVLLLDMRHTFKTRVARSVAPYLVMYMLVVTPWMLRNYYGFGFFQLASTGEFVKPFVASILEAGKANPREFPSYEQIETAWEKRISSYKEEFNASRHEKVELYHFCLVYPEHLSGEFYRFISTKASPDILQNFSLYSRYASTTLFRMLFQFNKDILASILDMPKSPQRTSEILRALAAGDFKGSFVGMKRLTWIDYAGLIWSGTYMLGLSVLAAGGLAFGLTRERYLHILLMAVIIGSLLVLPSFTIIYSSNMARYRLPAVPYLVLLATVGLNCTYQRFGSGKKRLFRVGNEVERLPQAS